MISIITPVRPDSDLISDYLTGLREHITDPTQVEVILAIALGDTPLKEKIEPHKKFLNIKVIEMEKNLGKLAFEHYLTILSHIAKGWVICFLADDIRINGRNIDDTFNDYKEEYAGKPRLFYFGGFGAYPSMTREWFDQFGWGPFYGVDTFLNTVTGKLPKYGVNLSNTSLTDLFGKTDAKPTPVYKPVGFPSPEFDKAVVEFVEKVKTAP